MTNDTFSVGVDLGGTNLRIASYTSGVDFLDTILLPTRLNGGREQVVRDMCEGIEALVSRGYGLRLKGIGVGAPGPLELPEGVLRNPPNLPGWDGFNLRQAIEEALGRQIEIESDANLAALAEQKLGAGKTHNVESLCMLTLGTGVGSGLILNGHIWHGATGMGGESGHIIVQDVDGAACGCGGFGCLEQYASAPAVRRMAREIMGDGAPSSSHELALLVRTHAEAQQVFERVGHSLAIALTALVNTLNLPLYLIGGGVSEAWDLFAPVMFHELSRRSYVYRLTKPEELEPEVLVRHKTYICGAHLGPKAGLLGACLLPFQQSEMPSLTEDIFRHQQLRQIP